MMKRMVHWLIKKLAAWANVPVLPVCPNDDVQLAAMQIVYNLRLFPDTSGEWKRHQAYANLIKKFPEVKRQDLALAIEWAVQRCFA